ncbi:MAG: PAS domain-containing protein [Caldilineaceae bacterium]
MINQATTHTVSPAMLMTLRRLHRATVLSLIVLGALVLLGWALDLVWLKNFTVTAATTKANSALGFVLTGLALGLQQASGRRQRYVAQAAAGVVVLLSLMTLSQYLFGGNWGIDEFLLREVPLSPLTAYPGRMAINTGLCFLLTSCALLLLDAQTAWGRPAEWLALTAGFITLIALIGYIYGVIELVSFFNFTSMAFPTILGFVVLCWGILLARPQQGVMAHFWSSGPQGIMARRMAFGGTLSLLALSYLTRSGERLGFYDHAFESSLLLSLGIGIFALLVYQSMGALAQLEAQRQANLAAFQEQYALLQGILNNTHDGIYVRDLQGCYRLVNKAGAALVGMTPATMLGKSYHTLFPPVTATLIQNEDQAVLQTKSPQVSEMTGGLPDQPKVLHSVKSPYRDFTGNVIGVLNVVRDITDRKQAEERLLKAQQEQTELLALLEALLDNAPIGFAFFDRELRFVRVNQTLAAINQLPVSAHLGQPLAVILPDLAPLLVPMIQQVFATGQGVYNQPVNGAHPAAPADVRHVLASWYPVTVDETGVRYVGAAIVDVTDLQRAEDKLRALNNTLEQRVAERTAELVRSNRELDQFAYVASHDLKAPLRAIMNLANWVIEDAAPVLPPPSQEHLAKLRGRALRMERLLDDLLAYSRIGRRDGGVEEVQVAQLIQDIVELLTLPLGFRVLVQTGMPTIFTARAPLELVFRNLIGNALKHHHQPAAGEVRISAEEQGDFIRFCVHDNGPGIEPRYHERIFEIFQTLQPRDEVEGSGMGLAIVKKTVEVRGGGITVQSTVGNGARFCFTWPQAVTRG